MAGCRRAFSTRGINVGLDELIRLSGVSKMGLYGNYATRALMVESVIHDIITEVTAKLEATAKEVGRDPMKKLLAVVDELCVMAAGGTDSAYEVLSFIQAGLPALSDVNHLRANTGKDRIKQLLADLSRAVSPLKADSIAESLMLITDGVTIRGLQQDRQEASRSGQDMSRIVLKAMAV